MCIRQPNNKILSHIENITSVSDKYKILGLPFLRGIVALFETFYIGVKGIYFSANTALGEEDEFTYKEFAVAIAAALGFAGFFFVIPFILTSLLNISGLIFNIVEAIVRLTIFILYLFVASLWGEYKRVLQYHGAEHKTINTFEAGAPLNIGNIKKFSCLHPRCGTSFIFIVAIVSILLFSVMPNLGFLTRLSYRIILIPVISGISYELLKFSSKYNDLKIIRLVTYPGLLFQRLTTREPDEDMIEVAMTAVKEILRLSSKDVKK
jgi:uncharacterized protein YqhQ